MRRTVRTKWHLLGAYWSFMAICIVVLWPWFYAGASPWRLDADSLVMLIAFPFLALLQWLLLRPVRRPRAGNRTSAGRWFHAALAGLGVGTLGWLALAVVRFAIEEIERRLGSSAITSALDATLFRWWWVCPLLISALSTIALALRARRSRSLSLSMAIAGLAAAGLVMGAVGIVASALNLLNLGSVADSAGLSTAILFLVSWAASTTLLLNYTRKRPTATALSRICSRLFLGSMIEAVAAIPIDAMVRRKSDCYCEQGTAMTLTICWAVGLVACGPVVFLLPIRRRRRRWHGSRCPSCHYSMAGNLNAERCPECGAGWRPRRELASALNSPSPTPRT